MSIDVKFSVVTDVKFSVGTDAKFSIDVVFNVNVDSKFDVGTGVGVDAGFNVNTDVEFSVGADVGFNVSVKGLIGRYQINVVEPLRGDGSETTDKLIRGVRLDVPLKTVNGDRLSESEKRVHSYV